MMTKKVARMNVGC